MLQMEPAQGGSLVPEQPQGSKFQPVLNIRTTRLYLPVFEGIFTGLNLSSQLVLDTALCSYPSLCWSAAAQSVQPQSHFAGTASPASGRSSIEAQAGFGDEVVNPMPQGNQIEPSNAEVHNEKPLPVRQRHFRKPERIMRPAVVVKAMKKTTRKDQNSSFNRVATGLVQQSGGLGRPVREKKSRRDWAVSQQACLLSYNQPWLWALPVLSVPAVGLLSCTVNDHIHFKDVAAVQH